MFICIFLRNIWRGGKSGFGKLFSSQNTEAEQTFQLSLAGHHSHPMYLFFFSDKRATFGIAQAAELIIRTPWGCFKPWAYLPHITTRLSKASPEVCPMRGNQICYFSNFLSLFKTSMPRAGTCYYFSESLASTQCWS